MKRTRILAIALAVLMAVTLVSCNGNPKTPETKTIELPTHIDVTRKTKETVDGVETSYKTTTYSLDYTYDDNGRLTSETETTKNGEESYIERTEYTYDEKGNLKSWIDTFASGNTDTYTYVADLDWFQIIADCRGDHGDALKNTDLKFTDDGKLESLNVVYSYNDEELDTATITIDYDPSTGLPSSVNEDIEKGNPNIETKYKYNADTYTCAITKYLGDTFYSCRTIRFNNGWSKPVSQRIEYSDKSAFEMEYNEFGAKISEIFTCSIGNETQKITKTFDDYGFPKSYRKEYSDKSKNVVVVETDEYTRKETKRFDASNWQPMIEKAPYETSL